MFSVPLDSKGRTLTVDQAMFFQDSRVRNKLGNLLVLYHGTAYDFTVFDERRTGANCWTDSDFSSPPAFFFTTDRYEALCIAQDVASKPGAQYPKLLEVYVNIENPLVMTAANTTKLDAVYRVRDHPSLYFAFYFREILLAALDGRNDGIIIKGYHGRTLVIAFRPEQIKLVTNLVPTLAPDIRL